MDLLPIVGGGRPSSEMPMDCLQLREETLVLPVGTVEYDCCPFTGAAIPLRWPDSGYGLFFLEIEAFLSFAFN